MMKKAQRIRYARGNYTPPANPVITSSATISVAENAVLAHMLTADVPVTWAIIGGADQSDCELSSALLRWAGNITQDYEAPNDADTNNTYAVQVRATRPTGQTATQNIIITVTDVAEGGGTSIVLNDQGVIAPLSNVSSYGQHTDGSYWVVQATSAGVGLAAPSIDPVETIDLFMGGAMIDPGQPAKPDVQKQGFDWRTTGNKTNPAGAPSGSGPGNHYDASYALSYPATVSATAGNPSTIWIYRGLDNAGLTTGGGASGCAYMVQITVYSSAPAANTIKPPGLYVAGGKPVKTRSDLNFAALPSLALPSGAVEPNWDATFGFHVRPHYRWGYRNDAASYTPNRTQGSYPADHASYTSLVATGCCYNITKRQELIERMVRDGMESQAGTLLAGNTAGLAAGGFGIGLKLTRFIAGIVLGDAAYNVQPGKIPYTTGASAVHEFFAEDELLHWSVKKTGDVADPSSGTYQALFGAIPVISGDFPFNHLDADPANLRDSYRCAQFNWVVESVGADFVTVTAASHDFTKVNQPENSVNFGYNRLIKITSGANAGKFLCASNKVGGVDVFWNAATRKLTFEVTASFGLPADMPSVGDTLEYRNATVYEQVNAGHICGLAATVVLMNKVSEYCSGENQRALFMYAKDQITSSGKLTDKKTLLSPFQRSNNVATCTWGPGEPGAAATKWLTKIYPAISASWPAFTGPL